MFYIRKYFASRKKNRLEKNQNIERHVLQVIIYSHQKTNKDFFDLQPASHYETYTN
jgi:DNA modification methylase